MDIGTIIGFVLGFVSLLGGMYFKHVHFSALANPAALFVIFIGTAATVTLATPTNVLANIPKVFGVLLGKPKYMEAEQAINMVTSLAETVRKDGILSLEKDLNSFQDRFIKNGIQMLIDGSDSHYIEETLDSEITAMEARHAANAQMFAQGGAYAPTLGVMGAVMGLISALSNLNDIDALGAAISAAFMATMMGIFTGYVWWNPIANKLKQKSKQEVVIKSLLLTGIVGLCEGQNPRMLRDRLMIRLSELQQKSIGVKDGGGQ